ncbi:MAG: hypothetical protein Q8L66_04755 [Caulobacter sp.]|nr:hypothetical protein [Caulobacter sp.]
MSISPVGAPPPIRTPEAAEPAGPDRVNDHDGDDAATVAPRQTPPKGQGTVVDRTA